VSHPVLKAKPNALITVRQDQVTHMLRHYEYQNQCHTNKELLQTICSVVQNEKDDKTKKDES
jgi:hypothetical protein